MIFAINKSNLINPALLDAEKILWVIAHPDDESLFFAPTILNLLSPGALSLKHPINPKAVAIRRKTGHLLSLSTGDNEGLGSIRERELKSSCTTLNIESDHCIAFNHPELRDSESIWWEEELVRRVVLDYVAEWSIDLIITFDSYGISGHSNHRAISTALSKARLSNPHEFPPTHLLLSTSLLEKFTSLLSLPTTLLQRSLRPSHFQAKNKGARKLSSFFLSTPTQYLAARKSFAAHASQDRWFRTLFMICSRYLWFCELVEVVP